MLHFLEAGIEPGFEFFPFRAMRVFSTPGKAVEFVDIKLFEYSLKRHRSDNLRAEGSACRQRDRLRNDNGALPGCPVRTWLGCADHFHVGFFTDLLQQGRFALRIDQLAHRFQSFESILAVENTRLIRVTIFGEKDAAAKTTIDGGATHQHRKLQTTALQFVNDERHLFGCTHQQCRETNCCGINFNGPG